MPAPIGNRPSPLVTTPTDASRPGGPPAPATVQPTAPTGWITGLSPSRLAGTALVDGAAPLAAASGIGPSQALKLIRNGEVSIDVPMNAGDLAMLTIRPGTTLKMSLSVKEGVIDFPNSKLLIDPPIDGPLGTSITGIQMRADGRAEIELKPLPNVIVGNAAPAKLADFIDSLQSADSVPVKVLGFTVKELHRSGRGSGADVVDALSTQPATPAAPSKPNPVQQRFDFAAAKVSVKNVSFLEGTVPLGNAGRMRLGADSKLELNGGLSRLALSGRVSVKDLDLMAGGTSLRGAEGSADVAVEWTATGPLGANGLPSEGALTATLSNLAMRTESAVSRRANGDFLELAQGQVQNGTVTLTQAVKDGKPSGAPQADISLGSFKGTIARGQLTVPDGDGTAQIAVRQSTLDGAVNIAKDQVRFSGNVALDAVVTDFDANASSSGRKGAHIDRAAVKGNAQVDFDTFKGLTLQGRAAVDVAAHGVNVGEKGVSLSGGTAQVKGNADVRIDGTGVRLGNGTLNISASVQDGKIDVGDALSLDLKAGTRVDAALTQAFFGNRNVALDLSAARLEAQLDGGRVTLPGGSPIAFKDGTKLSFTLDKLSVPEEGIPEASGKLSLVANLAANEVDPASLAGLPGVNVTAVEGLEQQLRLSLGRFTIAKNGSFEVKDVSVGVEATVKRFTGQIR